MEMNNTKFRSSYLASHKADEQTAISVEGETDVHNINLHGVLKLSRLTKS